MRAPDIQFEPVHDIRRYAGVAVLVLGIAVVGAALMAYESASRTLQSTDARIAAARQAVSWRTATPAASATARIPEPRVLSINHAIARLNVPWRELFAAVEAQHSKEVALLSLLPVARSRTLLVEGEAAQPRAMLDYVERMREQPLFEEVYLTKHERRDQSPSQPYRFSIEARWKETQ